MRYGTPTLDMVEASELEYLMIQRFQGLTLTQFKRLAAQLGRKYKQRGAIIGLVGPLGTGKTTFVKGLAQGLGISANVVSPTFILIGSYKGAHYTLYHIDPYRLQKLTQLKAYLQELLQQKYAVVAVEWATKLKRLLPSDTIWIELRHRDQNKRSIKLS